MICLWSLLPPREFCQTEKATNSNYVLWFMRNVKISCKFLKWIVLPHKSSLMMECCPLLNGILSSSDAVPSCAVSSTPNGVSSTSNTRPMQEKSQEEGIEIVKNPEPQSVCAGSPAPFTWSYNAANRNFQNIYWRHLAQGGSGGGSIMCEYLLARETPSFTPTGDFTGRLQNIPEAPKAVNGGEVTLTVTETRLSDTGTIRMTIATTLGKETTGSGTLTVMKAPTLTPGQTKLGLNRSNHNMTTAYVHCTNIQDAGIPPANVSITMSVPGYGDSVYVVPVENGEGKQAFFGQGRFGTFKCALVGAATACNPTPFQSETREFFTAPGTPMLEPVEPRGFSAKVTFKAGFHGGTKVSFKAKYQVLGAEDWTDAPVPVDDLNEGQLGTFEINGLQTQTNYSVYIIATNSEGSKESMAQAFQTKASDGGLPGVAIAGIIVGVLIAVGVAAGIGGYCWVKQGKKEKSSLEEMERMNKQPVPV